MSETIGQLLPATGSNGAARAAALASLRDASGTATSLVGYHSQGRVLVAGPDAAVREAAARLAQAPVTVSLLITDGTVTENGTSPDIAETRVIRAPLAAVRGYLGAFQVDVQAQGEARPLAPSILTGNQPYDMVLDLGASPALTAQVPPPGYFAPCGDDARLEAALAEIPGLVGEFEKPRYFSYDTNICAHGARGQQGCTRCLDACPTDAIVSIGERVEVNPHLCQGGGVCATACPTGAMTYAYPTPADLGNRLRLLLSTYRDAGGSTPVVLLHDGEAGSEWLSANAQGLPEHVLPFAVEEVGSVGLEALLSLLAFGASRVLLLATPATPDSVRGEIEAQLAIARDILAGLGQTSDLLRLVDAGGMPECETAFEGVGDTFVKEFATFGGIQDKRAALRLAIDHLLEQVGGRAEPAALPAHSPFGHIIVNASTCTLCMACVAVCPAGAVITPGDAPRLDFIEQNCVQCRLCETACPEDAISLEARLVFDREQRASRRTLNEDEPFACVECGKIFGSTRTIEAMLSKLSGHWMFQEKPEQMQRLRMCEDCRVKDMFKDGGGLLDTDPGPRH